MIYYPWTENPVKVNDLVWVYDGQCLVRVVKIVETEQEMRQCGVNDVGFCFAYEASACHFSCYDSFMPQREMRKDMNYLATDIEKWGVKLLLHRLAAKYDLNEEKMKYAISYRTCTDESDDSWLRWDITIWINKNETRQFQYDEKEDVFRERNV